MRISLAESVVMQALWSQAPLTADEIVAAIAKDQGWTDVTVRTLINRLLKKKAISAKRDKSDGRRFLYRPIVKRADYVQEESQGLLDRLFDGRVAPLVSHFSQRRRLGAEDIAELRSLIDELDNGR